MRKRRPAATQRSLTNAGFWPMLPKTAVAVGKYASVLGKYWHGCPSADKEKRFMCIVVEFVALHDFGDGVKGASFKLKEMGEDGRGNLEPGIASGDEFVMAYPLPFSSSTTTSRTAQGCQKLCAPRSSVKLLQLLMASAESVPPRSMVLRLMAKACDTYS